jgi:TolB-like protein
MAPELSPIQQGNRNKPQGMGAPTAHAVREQLRRILDSSVFLDSRRMVRFLRFTVEETLNGNASRLKEIVIGAEVFDRPATYDPRLDPIVRVEARRLRAKLCSYYKGLGERDDVIVDFPKGGYSPVFQFRSEIGAPPAAPSTIAVLPFLNLAPEKGSDYFSDGLSEELIHALTRIRGLRVVAWNSASQLRERQEDIGAIRQRLDVAYVLRGSVRRTDQRLRITAHLVETASGQYVWSETYDQKMRDVFAIQEQIATAIAGALKLRFSREEAGPAVEVYPHRLEVFQLCLQGRFHSRERTSDGFKRSIVCFEQAIALDGASAAAHAGLADTYTLIADYGFLESSECMRKARSAAERALELDPLSADAHASRGLILTLHDWHWEEAGAAFERAIEINPAYEPAHHWYGIDHLAMLGRFEEASEHLEIAIKLDPLASILFSGRAYLHLLCRRYDRALALYAEMLEGDPSLFKAYTSSGRVYIQMGMYRKAIVMLERGRELAGDLPNILGALGQAYGLAGDQAAARRMLQRLHEISGTAHVLSSAYALAHLGLGEKDAALTWLERCLDRREPTAVGLKVHPAFDGLRDEPRFQALLDRIGFLP